MAHAVPARTNQASALVIAVAHVTGFDDAALAIHRCAEECVEFFPAVGLTDDQIHVTHSNLFDMPDIAGRGNRPVLDRYRANTFRVLLVSCHYHRLLMLNRMLDLPSTHSLQRLHAEPSVLIRSIRPAFSGHKAPGLPVISFSTSAPSAKVSPR